MRQSTNKNYINLFHELLLKNRSITDVHKERCFLAYKEMVELFHQAYKRYPTATEFTHENLLPNAREIQRNYGGLKKFREDIGLSITDYTTGEVRTKAVKKILKRAKEYEFELFSKLFKKLHRPNEGIVVVQEPVISFYEPTIETYGYRKADVGINDYTKGNCTTTYIDFFYASTLYSFFGCVNMKRKKIKGLVDIKDIIFVSVNPKMTKEILSTIKLPKNSPRVLSYEEFIEEFQLS